MTKCLDCTDPRTLDRDATQERAAVPDHLVKKIRPAIPRNNPHQILLNFLRVLLLREFQPAREIRVTCGVDHHPYVLFKPCTENHIRSFCEPLRSRVSQFLSIVSGTLPPKSETILRAAPTTDFDLLRKNPVERISGFELFQARAWRNPAALGIFRKEWA